MNLEMIDKLRDISDKFNNSVESHIKLRKKLIKTNHYIIKYREDIETLDQSMNNIIVRNNREIEQIEQIKKLIDNYLIKSIEQMNAMIDADNKRVKLWGKMNKLEDLLYREYA